MPDERRTTPPPTRLATRPASHSHPEQNSREEAGAAATPPHTGRKRPLTRLVPAVLAVLVATGSAATIPTPSAPADTGSAPASAAAPRPIPVSFTTAPDAPLLSPALSSALLAHPPEPHLTPRTHSPGCPTRRDRPHTPAGCTAITTAAAAAVATAAVDAPRATDDASGGPYRAEHAISVGQMWAEGYGCTATVVTSHSGNVAVTAAHCVYHPATGPLAGDFPTAGPVYDQFIPARTGDTAPYGSWTIDMAFVDPRWRDTGDPAYDIAFLHLARHDGRSIQDVVGSQGISFTPPPAGTAATVLGYPHGTQFDGRTLRRCSTRAITIDPTVWNTAAMPCAMTVGASGGPWLTGFDPATGTGTLVAVSSVHEHNGPRLFARPIGDAGYPLYRSADH